MLSLAISSALNTFHIRSVYVCSINTSRENINYSDCILENIINGQKCSCMSNILGLKRVFVLRKSWKSTKMSESFIKSISKNNFEKKQCNIQSERYIIPHLAGFVKIINYVREFLLKYVLCSFPLQLRLAHFLPAISFYMKFRVTQITYTTI